MSPSPDSPSSEILFSFVIRHRRDPLGGYLCLSEVTQEVFAWDMGGPRPIICGDVTKYTIEKKNGSYYVTLKMIVADDEDKNLARTRIVERYENCEME